MNLTWRFWILWYIPHGLASLMIIFERVAMFGADDPEEALEIIRNSWFPWAMVSLIATPYMAILCGFLN